MTDEKSDDAVRLQWCMELLITRRKTIDGPRASIVTDVGCGCCGEAIPFDAELDDRAAIDFAMRRD